MNDKLTRTTIHVIPILLIGLLLACSGGPSTAQGDLVTRAARAGEAQPLAPQATTYYVRSDGGSPDQCTGLANGLLTSANGRAMGTDSAAADGPAQRWPASRP